jgi:hypothetical protein
MTSCTRRPPTPRVDLAPRSDETSPQSAQGQPNWLSIVRLRLPQAREERIDRKIRRSASLLIF